MGRRLDGVHLGDVVGHDDRADGPLGLRDAQGPVHQVPHLGGVRAHVDVTRGDVLEQGDQVDLLLVVAAQRPAVLLAHDGDHRLVVHLGVVQPVEQVDRAGARRGQADADLAGELGVGRRHERGQLLVPGLDELHGVVRALGALQRAHDGVDAVPREAVDALDAPLVEAFDHEVRDRLAHGVGPLRVEVTVVRWAAPRRGAGAPGRARGRGPAPELIPPGRPRC